MSTEVKTKKVQVELVKIPEARIRKDLGDLSKLKESLQLVGLIEPIIVTADEVLVTGRRRLQAAKELGWKEIDAEVKSYDEIDIKIAEIDENLQRKDLDWQEGDAAVKKKLELLATMEGRFSPATQSRSEKGTFATTKQPLPQLGATGKNSSASPKSSDSEQKSAGKLPPPPTSQRGLAQKLKVPHSTLDRQIKRAQYIERYPVLKQLKEKSAVETLGKMREDRELDDEQLARVVKKVKEKQIPAKIAVALLKLEPYPGKEEEVLAYYQQNKSAGAGKMVQMVDSLLWNLQHPPGGVSSDQITFNTAAEVANASKLYSVKINKPSFDRALNQAAKEEKVSPETFIALGALDRLKKNHALDEELADAIESSYREE